MVGSIEWLMSLMADKGQHRYGLHDVSQLQHALQSALFVERSGGGPALIAAALLHDIGTWCTAWVTTPPLTGLTTGMKCSGTRFWCDFSRRT